MDPFSITVGAVSLVDVCWRIAVYLKDVRKAIASVDKEIQDLIDEVESLGAIFASAEECLQNNHAAAAVASPLKALNLETLWKRSEQSLDNSRDLTTQLEKVVHEIYGKSGAKTTGKLDGLGKESRRRDKKAEVQRLRAKLFNERQNLQVLIMGIGLYNHQTSQDKLDTLSTDLRSMDQGVKLKIATLEARLRSSDTSDRDEHDDALLSSMRQLRDSVKSVTTAVSVTAPNKFFDIPQGVSSVYTGRSLLLEKLQNIFFTANAGQTEQQQQRFVIFGLSGSGKTQFCSKFAEQNRESFWGVFWIDASSHERIKQTYAEIARLGNLDPNHKAAMHWLSNLEARWLLLIDNADDSDIELEEYFPKGDRGHILITTRNPGHKVHGNVGPGFFEFQGMEEDDASALLLRSAQLKQPVDTESSSWATVITKQLGFLALALIHAGATIRNGLCSLKNFPVFYEQNWERVRRTSNSFLDSGDNTYYLSALTTFEMSYDGILEKQTQSSGDAIQLLKMFSFFYFKNIRFDIMRRAVLNCEIEKADQEKAEREKGPLTWYQTYDDIRLYLLRFIAQDQGSPALPPFIQQGRDLGFFDEVRVRYALKELVQSSLVTYDEINDSYSMHPLVHRWVRERPEMSASDQALWSEIVATTIGHSLLIPPLGDTESDELYRSDILPHIDHVRKCQDDLTRRNEENGTIGKPRWYNIIHWLWPSSPLGPSQAIIYAKFSIVFVHTGRWKEAEKLQLAVKRYTDRVLGLHNPKTRRITLALANTYRNQGKIDEASDLEDAVLQACIACLGPNNHETLMTMDRLGQTRWWQGRYSEAKMLLEHALDGLAKMKGPNHEDTLTAMWSLGRTVAKLYEDLDEAERLLKSAWDGMIRTLGPTHFKTLVAKEELAMHSLLTERNLPMASEMLEQVVDSRRTKLGKEHPYTLLAVANWARVRNVIGEHSEAEILVLEALPIAIRNFSEDHIAVLMGRTILAGIFTCQSRFAEAESTLLEVIEKQRHLSSYRGDFHPDRLGAMIELAWCFRLQGKYDDSIRLSDEIIEGLAKISLKEHPLETRTKAQKREMIELKRAGGEEGKLS